MVCIFKRLVWGLIVTPNLNPFEEKYIHVHCEFILCVYIVFHGNVKL